MAKLETKKLPKKYLTYLVKHLAQEHPKTKGKIKIMK